MFYSKWGGMILPFSMRAGINFPFSTVSVYENRMNINNNAVHINDNTIKTGKYARIVLQDFPCAVIILT